jgi:hypothetical protein
VGSNRIPEIQKESTSRSQEAEMELPNRRDRSLGILLWVIADTIWTEEDRDLP